MRPSKLHGITPLAEEAAVPKGRQIIWNNNMEVTFQELKKMVSSATLLDYSD